MQPNADIPRSGLRVSVVLNSYGDARLLRRALAMLMVQTLAPSQFEIVVVGRRGERAGSGVVQRLRQWSTGCPRLRRVAAPPDATPPVMRNVGWRAAHSQIIAFTDDDTLVDREWLQRGPSAMTPGTDAVAGHLVVPLPEQPSIYDLEASSAASAELSGANCFLRRATLGTVGGFDERFDGEPGADMDLLFRLIERQAHLRRAPDALVLRPLPRKRWSATLETQRRLVFDALLFAKHPMLYRTHVRTAPRWDHYSMVALLLLWPTATALGYWPIAAPAFAGWIALVAAFCVLHLQEFRHPLDRIGQVLAAAIAVPPVAVFWRIVGWLRFRVILL